MQENLLESFFEISDITALEWSFADQWMPKSDEARLFLLYLMRASKLGHLCVTIQDEQIYPEVFGKKNSKRAFLGLGDLGEKVLSNEGNHLCLTPLCRSENHIYLQRNHFFETQIYAQIKRLQASIFPSFPELGHLGDQLLPAQKEAVTRAWNSNLTLICGGPGTGKTYTATHLLRKLHESGLQACICAPTGKAVSQLKDRLDFHCQAMTLHQLLQLKKNSEPKWQKKELGFDLILVDEASMVDARLFAHLLTCTDSKLVLMGDPDQLPPVEAGSIFADLCDALDPVTLQSNKRVSALPLQQFSTDLRLNKIDGVMDYLKDHACPLYSTHEFLDQVVPKVHLSSKDKINPIEALKALGKFRVLSALRKGPYGVDELNFKLLSRIQESIEWGFYYAEPILIVANDHQKQLYNGMSGVMISKKGSDEKRVYFMGSQEEIRDFSPQELPKYEYGYVLSVHKSQGSEFEQVLLLIAPGTESFGKEVIYTAATRAKRELKISGDKELLLQTLRSSSRKTSGLKQRFKRTTSSH